jgi:phage tail sheath gpL-like
MSIAFNEIALNVRTPGMFAEFDSSRAVKGVQLAPHDTLLIGQMTSGGSGTAGQVYSPKSVGEAIALFGNKSDLVHLVAAYKAVDTLTPIFCIGVADAGSAVLAAGEFTFSGTSTEAGEIDFYIGGRRVPCSVPNNTSAATLETLAVAAFALETDLPVTASADGTGTGVVTTAINGGTYGNQIQLGVCLLPGERVPAGLTVTITPMTGGATDISVAAAVTAMGEDQYHTVVTSCNDTTNLGLLNTEMISRWGAMRSIEGHLFSAKYDTAANLVTYGGNFNSQCMTVVGAEKSALLPLPLETAAMVAGISALQCQTDPARAMTGASLGGKYAAARGTRFTRAQRNSNLGVGISTVKASSDGRLIVDRLVTTYQTNAASVADTAYQDLYLVRTLAAYRYSLRARLGQRFNNFKLGDDGNEISGQPIATPRIVKAEILAHFLECQDLGWVENFEQFKAELLVQRNAIDPNRMDAIVPPDIINAFLVGALSIQFRR